MNHNRAMSAGGNVKRIALLSALALLWAGAAFSQTKVQNGQTTRGVQQIGLVGGIAASDSSGQALYLDPNTHGLNVGDVSRDRDLVTLFSNAIATQTLAVAAACSTSVLDVHAYRYLKLLIKAVPQGGANTTVRLGFQFREMMNASVDSSSTFSEYQYGKIDNSTTTASVVDTTLVGHIVTGAATTAWSDERVLLINGNRSAPGNGVAAVVFSQPNGVSIPLDNFFGRVARFNQLQIRVRNLNANSPSVTLTLHVLGFAQ